MKYYIIAGEASGDLHGANLIKAIKEQDSSAQVRVWGGELMQKEGAELVKHYKDLAFMGFFEVVQNLRTILKNISFCKSDILAFKPDVLIFIDYPGFNMRIAKWAKQQGIATHYYISPQIWAWKENRIKAIKRDVDYMYVILPFEQDFYQNKHGFKVNFVGHPLVDAIENYRRLPHQDFIEHNNLDHRPIIALLPGSRKQEISKLLQQMLSVVKFYPDYQFIIAGAPGQEQEFYNQFVKGSDVKVVFNQTYALLNIAYAALVTSGTATLETALFRVPQVVLYKGNEISYQIAKRIITLKFISLVNLIMDKELVVELIQADCNSDNIKKELDKILSSSYRENLIKQYDVLISKLGAGGASQTTARCIIQNSTKG
ncbi:lipid-A-disaccharide synthase [Myroides sp. LJL110]